MKLILVRHGETNLNRDGRILGLTDASLNATGRAQARAVATPLAVELPFQMYSSPLVRAVETAQIVTDALEVTATPNSGLQEADAGEFARDHMHKKVVTYIAGLSAPKGRTMGHAGAIVTGSGESAAEKIEIMRECRIPVIEHPSDFGTTISKMI